MRRPVAEFPQSRGLRKNKMDKKIIYSKTGKGVLEIKNKAGKLPKDLVKVLALIDGKSNVADLIAKAKFSDAEVNKALSDLSTGGYIKEFANTSTGVPTIVVSRLMVCTVWFMIAPPPSSSQVPRQSPES